MSDGFEPGRKVECLRPNGCLNKGDVVTVADENMSRNEHFAVMRDGLLHLFHKSRFRPIDPQPAEEIAEGDEVWVRGMFVRVNDNDDCVVEFESGSKSFTQKLGVDGKEIRKHIPAVETGELEAFKEKLQQQIEHNLLDAKIAENEMAYALNSRLSRNMLNLHPVYTPPGKHSIKWEDVP